MKKRLKRVVAKIKALQLDGEPAAVMKAIYENPRARTKDIRVILKKQGVVASEWRINTTKTRMRRWFPEIDFTIKPEPIKLTKAQQKMIPDFKQVIIWALYRKDSPTYRLPKQLRGQFREFVESRILRLIKNYKRKDSKISTYLAQKIGYLYQDFIKKSLMDGTGLTSREVRLVLNIKREKHAGKTVAEIAKALKCSRQEVKELWKSFQEYQWHQSLLGKAAEK